MRAFKRVLVIMDKGFVYFGDLTYSTEEGMWELTNAVNVRRFGTERGLGQLALTGPTTDTVLDKVNTIFFFPNALQHIMECNEEVWAGHV